MSNLKKNNIVKIIIATVFILFFFIIYNHLKEFILISYLINLYEKFQYFILENLILSIILAILFFCLWVIFLLPFISLIQIFFGFVFDFYIGFFINFSSIIIGSLIIFLLIKTKIVSGINIFEVKNILKKYNNYLENKFLIIFLLRLIPGVPFMLQNIFAAVIKVETKTFLLSSSLGIWPLILLNTYFGSTIQKLSEDINFQVNMFNPYFLSLVILYSVFIFFKFIYKKKL